MLGTTATAIRAPSMKVLTTHLGSGGASATFSRAAVQACFRRSLLGGAGHGSVPPYVVSGMLRGGRCSSR